jgi:hypothetical protein
MYFLAKELEWLVVETIAVGLIVDAVPQMGPGTVMIGEIELEQSKNVVEELTDNEPPAIEGNPDATEIMSLMESSVRALQKSNELLKFVTNRRLMQINSSVLAVNALKVQCQSVLVFIEGRCKGLTATHTNQSTEIANIGCMTGAEIELLVGSIIGDVGNCLKRTHELAKNRKNKAEVGRKCSPESMEAFKKSCWDIHETIIEGCRQPDDRQRR